MNKDLSGEITAQISYIFGKIKSLILFIIIAVSIGLTVADFIGRPGIIVGSSMSPTLRDGDVVIFESITPRFGKIEQGDIVSLRIPEILGGKNRKFAVKRVIATENQHIEIRDGKVFVDGLVLIEDYANNVETQIDNTLYSDMIVPEGCVYVIGDNRLPEESYDSRAFGPIKEDRITGKCWIRIYPFTRVGVVK
ncbi:MAG: signal peptidase I [Clostridiaceae bacterium]|nr:signal peptidase I [Clostridiaceae bacterium]